MIASIINILLVAIAVINRNTVNIGILAVAMSMAASLCQELMVLVVEWTSALQFWSSADPRCGNGHHVRRANPGIHRSTASGETTSDRR